jgi:hypothetical protein
LESKRDRDFKHAIAACKRYNMYNLMGFRYDWNIEVLLQFLATYYCYNRTDMLHWMTEGRHYKVNFVTFSCLLGLGAEDRGFSEIHDEHTLTEREIAFMYVDRRAAYGLVKGLKSYYYIFNNFFR